MTHNQIDYWNLQETIRANKAKEAENERSHRASEDIGYIGAYETIRHNVASEDISRQDLSERIRHNTVSEGETIRSDLAREQENIRHNMEAEKLQSQQIGVQQANVGLGYAQLGEQHTQFQRTLGSVLSNAQSQAMQAEAAQLRQQEDARHNKVVETQKWVDLGVSGVSKVAGLVLPFIK